MICPDAVVDDGKRKLVEAVLLLVPSGMLPMIIKKYLSMSRRKDGKTILLINSKGDREFAPSNKRVATVKFQFSQVYQISCLVTIFPRDYPKG